MDSSTRRLRVAGCLLAACSALLLFAATASAAVWMGESTTPLSSENLAPEATLVKSSASYDTSGGVTFTLTTAEPPLEKIGALDNEVTVEAFVFSPIGECTASAFIVSQTVAGIISSYATPETIGVIETPAGEVVEPATKTISGATTTLSFTSGALANEGFTCATVIQSDLNPGAEGESVASFSLAEVVAPPTSPSSQAPSASAPPAPAPPAKLAIAKAKPLELKAGKSRTVKVKVTNPGTVTSPQGSLTVKPAKGIKVKPATQTIPALAPGGSWILSIKVQASAKARKKTTLSLTAAASGVSATSPLVVKLKQ